MENNVKCPRCGAEQFVNTRNIPSFCGVLRRDIYYPIEKCSKCGRERIAPNFGNSAAFQAILEEIKAAPPVILTPEQLRELRGY